MSKKKPISSFEAIIRTFLIFGLIYGAFYLYFYTKTFDWKAFKFHTDTEYIAAAEPHFRKFIQDNYTMEPDGSEIKKLLLTHYPETEVEKNVLNFKSYISETANLEIFGEKHRVPSEARSGGKYIYISLTPEGQCYQYGIEYYISSDLERAILTYSNYPGKISGSSYGEVLEDPNCPMLQQSKLK